MFCGPPGMAQANFSCLRQFTFWRSLGILRLRTARMAEPWDIAFADRRGRRSLRILWGIPTQNPTKWFCVGNEEQYHRSMCQVYEGT